ncbi:cytochrome P450 [Polaribacter glomeratus]|uniref:Cytochrome P450 n=1 Tax=Polaribacter glomeratus TaxID=102 RepID=A0A2S7WWZ9_9FLAO|nr:cytochrome P450 [Polaribacter glomeratus]PQJ82077.1 cytochrome P450 [Polaribacter glomeratus]TXD66671.1 cytochrome P450 [Polaribacter glomeratus]
MNNANEFPIVPLTSFIKHSLEILKNPLPFHRKNFENLGDTFQLNVGFKTHIFFSRDAKLLEYVLQKNQKNYTKSKIQTKEVAKYLGKGLLTAEGEHWKKQRKLIQPAFHKQKIKGLLTTIQEQIRDNYSQLKTNNKFDVFPIFNDLAFQVVAKALFSSTSEKKDIAQLQQITEDSQRMLVKELRQPYLGWWFSLSGKIQEYKNLTEDARQILKKIVEQRKKSNARFNDLLDLLLDSKYEDGSAMEEKQLMDEILILFVAGHETTSNSLTFTSQLLAQHPEWQERIFKEAKTLNENNDDLMEIVGQSKICQQVIEESMRLYPPAYFIDRLNYKTDEYNGIIIKPQSDLLFSIYEIHRHPKLWKNPEQFQPERFENGSREYSSQYFPFGAGPRKCIGNNFAMFEMIIAVREMVLNYKIKPQFATIGITPLITLKPNNAYLELEKR